MRIFTIGETTYDIIFENGRPTGGCSGGSAYNSAISLGRCGLPVSLITTFGNDKLGDLSLNFLNKNGVNCDLVKRFEGRSRLAIAFIDDSNNADYSFYQASKDVVPDYPDPQKNDIILLGSSFALRDNGRDNLLGFLSKARDNGAIIIYDPNARQPISENTENYHKIMQNISLATIIKGSDQDFDHIYRLNRGAEVYDRISEFGNKILVYTKGADGAELHKSEHQIALSAKKVKVVSTIGAGDNFSAGIVYGLSLHLTKNQTMDEFTLTDWNEVMKMGLLFASDVCGSTENYLSHSAANQLNIK